MFPLKNLSQVRSNFQQDKLSWFDFILESLDGFLKVTSVMFDVKVQSGLVRRHLTQLRPRLDVGTDSQGTHVSANSVTSRSQSSKLDRLHREIKRPPRLADEVSNWGLVC